MTKEVIREMYQLLLTEPHAPTVCAKLERIARDALARPDHIPDAKKMVAQPEQEPVALPCCGYTDASAVKWNPYNQVVQCHNCGQVYTTTPQRTWVELTWSDIPNEWVGKVAFMEGAKWAAAKLKEKNGA